MNVKTLICHYNYTNFLKRSLESAKNQTYKKNSICLVDDFSNDQDLVLSIFEEVFGEPINAEFSKEYKALYFNDDNMCILLNKNGGPSRSRNFGIELNKHNVDFFAILDADDEMIPEKIEELIKPFVIYGDHIGVTYGDYLIKNEKGYITKEFKRPFDINLLYKECIVHSGALISNKALQKVKTKYGYYDERFRVCEDYQLWLKICQLYMIFHVPKILTTVNDHSNNSTNTVSKESWQEHWSKLRESLNENSVQ